MVDAVGVADDVAVRRLPKDRLQPDHGGAVARSCLGVDSGNGSDDVFQHAARADTGELVHIAHQEQVHAWGQRLEQMVHEDQVEHRRLVHHQQIRVQRRIFVPFKGDALAGLKLKQAVDGLCLAAGRL